MLPHPWDRILKRRGRGSSFFFSGQDGFDPTTGKLVEGGIAEQTRQVLRNLSAVLEAGGSSLRGSVRTRRARSTVQGERWPDGSLVAMEAIAVSQTDQ